MSEDSKEKLRRKGISKDLRRNLHNALCNFAQFYMVKLGLKFYDLRETIPDLIAVDNFGNIIVVEALSKPNSEVAEEKIRRYRMHGAKKILFAVPYLTDDFMDVVLDKPDVDVIDMGLEEQEEVTEE